MERDKPLPWLAFVGCVLGMVSLVAILVVNIYLEGQSSDIYRSRPLANIVGAVLLVLGIILITLGSRKTR